MRVFPKKLVVFLCVIAVSIASVAFAAVSLTSRPSTHLVADEIGESAADKVTIYGNGVTFVNYEEDIQLEENVHTLQFYLPYGTLTNTLMVSGVDVVKITTSDEYHPIIERGDIITVHTEEGAYTGKFLGWDNMLLLEANNGTIMIPGSRITKIVLSEVVQTQGPKILVEVTTSSLPGEYQVRVSYLMRGPKWKPTYFIDLETSHLQCWATIENVENWNNVTLVLISGGPHLVYGGPIVQPYIWLAESAAYSPSVDWTSTTVDEFHEYVYDAKVSFEKGTLVKLPLFNGTVSLRQEYFWTSGDVQNRYHINNTLNEPLAAGIAEFYRGEVWVGEDSIPYTPVKGETVAVVNYAYDIKVTSEVTKSIQEYHRKVQGIEVTIRNHKTTAIQILIQQDIRDYTLVTSTPTATRVGPTLSLILNVDAEGAATIYYEWEYVW